MSKTQETASYNVFSKHPNVQIASSLSYEQACKAVLEHMTGKHEHAVGESLERDAEGEPLFVVDWRDVVPENDCSSDNAFAIMFSNGQIEWFPLDNCLGCSIEERAKEIAVELDDEQAEGYDEYFSWVVGVGSDLEEFADVFLVFGIGNTDITDVCDTLEEIGDTLEEMAGQDQLEPFLIYLREIGNVEDMWETKRGFAASYVGEFKSGADFAQSENADEKIPEPWCNYIDWQAYYQSVTRHDCWDVDGHFFRN